MVPTASHQSASGCTVDETNLLSLAAAWPSLPVAVKAGIMAMVQTIDGTSSETDSAFEEE